MKSEVSRYSVNELPTWKEILDWYNLESRTYDPEKDREDYEKYWKVPKKAWLIGMMCNQFNKMITEDGYRKDLVIKLNALAFNSGELNPDLVVSDIIFYPFNGTTCSRQIYSFIGNSSDVFSDPTYPHMLLDDFDKPMAVTPFLIAFDADDTPHIITITEKDFPDILKMIIDYMMEPYIAYVNAEKGKQQACIQLGYDPAK